MQRRWQEMKKKLSVRAAASLLLSALLFCMPIGAFIANSGNTVDAYAEESSTEGETEESTGTEENTETGEDEAGETESESGGSNEETEGGTVSGNEVPKPECTCKEKCTQYSYDKDCEVCKGDYSLCEYVNPNVKITISTPSGWHNDTTKVHISIEDVVHSGNFTIKTVQAKIAQNGSWTDITEDMYVEISENTTVYVLVTDQRGKTYEKNRYIKCFDFTKPTLNAAVSDGLLSVQAHDTDSGIKAVYVNGYEFTELTNGVLNIRLQQFDAGYQYFTISAMDNAGNMSEVYKTANPYYTDPEKEDSSEKNPAEQLPVNAQATKPSSATAQVTEHTKTDSDGNTVSELSPAEQKKQAMAEAAASEKKEESGEKEKSETGKEFYTIQTASEKVFYLIIDRDREEEMVYFLTEVTENDLLNVTADNSETLPKNSAALESAIPVTEGALPNNNGEQETVEEPAEEPTEDGEENTEEPEPEPEKTEENPMATYIILGVVAAAAIGGGYYFKVVRKKKEEFLDEDDEEDEEYDDEEEEKDSEDDFFDDNGEE
ncbi:CD1107 family mobile element protein [uncultured Clostridium sp.]|uniref:CD1107 family mobile element protein n=1 Tax=uncultured Clostridium sp. TaxID=59620 RepID=UPI0034A0CE16